jgi:hypothetical protein
LASNCKDESWLLRGQALRDAQAWAAQRSLSDRDYQFLSASQNLEQREIEIALEEARKKGQILDDVTDDLYSERGIDYSHLQALLVLENWTGADRETKRIMLKIANREKEDFLDLKSIEAFPLTDLRTIDRLWVKYSAGRFGFSTQKRIWQEVKGKFKQYWNRTLATKKQRLRITLKSLRSNQTLPMPTIAEVLSTMTWAISKQHLKIFRKQQNSIKSRETKIRTKRR